MISPGGKASWGLSVLNRLRSAVVRFST